jgi:hypothetical protein
LLRLLQGILLKFLPLYFVGVAIASHPPENHGVAFLWLGVLWWNLGAKFRGPPGVRWRAWASVLAFGTVMMVSGYLFIDFWHSSWAGFWVFAATGASLMATHGEEPNTAEPVISATPPGASAPAVNSSLAPQRSPGGHVFGYVRRAMLLLLAGVCLLGGIGFLGNSARHAVHPVVSNTGAAFFGSRLRMVTEAAQTNGMNFALGLSLVAGGLLALNRATRPRDGGHGPLDRLLVRHWKSSVVRGRAARPITAIALLLVTAGWLSYQSVARTRFHFSAADAAEAFKREANFNLFVTGNLMYGVAEDGETTHVARFTPALVRALNRNETSAYGPVRPHEYPLPGMLPVAVLAVLAGFAYWRRQRSGGVRTGSDEPDTFTARSLLIFGLVNGYVVVWLVLGQRDSLFMDTRFFQAGVIDPDGLVNAAILLVAGLAVLVMVCSKIEARLLPLAARLGWNWIYFATSLAMVAWSYGFSNAAHGSPALLWILLYLATGALCWLTIYPELTSEETA